MRLELEDLYIAKWERRELVQRCFFACAFTAGQIGVAYVLQFIARHVV